MSASKNNKRTMPLLVIVIPAYKYQYLEQTLLSLTKQTESNFLVFVGDDAGPPEIAEICSNFSDRLEINYHRFHANMGGKSLTCQWERCIAMTDAPWIMLLGDDDTLDPGCIEKFYITLNNTLKKNNLDLYRFNTRIIDGNGIIIRENPLHKCFSTTTEFLESRFSGASSYVVEFIFSRRIYREMGGFVDFPLAWCSDDATWAKFSLKNGIFCLEGPKVSWRLSGNNISSFNPAVARQKLETNLAYLMWLKKNLFPTLNLKHKRAQQLKNEAVEWFILSSEYLKIHLTLSDILRFSFILHEFCDVGFLSLISHLLKVSLSDHLRVKRNI